MVLEQEHKAELASIMQLLQSINKRMVDIEYDITQAFIRMHNLLEEVNKK